MIHGLSTVIRSIDQPREILIVPGEGMVEGDRVSYFTFPCDRWAFQICWGKIQGHSRISIDKPVDIPCTKSSMFRAGQEYSSIGCGYPSGPRLILEYSKLVCRYRYFRHQCIGRMEYPQMHTGGGFIVSKSACNLSL